MDRRIILYGVVVIAILILIVFTFFPNMIYVLRDSGDSDEDKCDTPRGQTEEEWREHMSHHPSMYKECLE